jgi:hypothetical protein
MCTYPVEDHEAEVELQGAGSVLNGHGPSVPAEVVLLLIHGHPRTAAPRQFVRSRHRSRRRPPPPLSSWPLYLYPISLPYLISSFPGLGVDSLAAAGGARGNAATSAGITGGGRSVRRWHCLGGPRRQSVSWEHGLERTTAMGVVGSGGLSDLKWGDIVMSEHSCRTGMAAGQRGRRRRSRGGSRAR